MGRMHVGREEGRQGGGAGDTGEREGYSTEVKKRRRRIMLGKERWRKERTENGGGRARRWSG